MATDDIRSPGETQPAPSAPPGPTLSGEQAFLQYAVQNQIAAQAEAARLRAQERAKREQYARLQEKAGGLAEQAETAVGEEKKGFSLSAETASNEAEKVKADANATIDDRLAAEEAARQWSSVVAVEHTREINQRREAYLSSGMVVLAVVTVLVILGYFIHGQIQNVEYARGMISLLLGVGTIVIALVLTLAAILMHGLTPAQRFQSGKEVFTVLIGVFGTIIGFYFGSMNDVASQSPDATAIRALGGDVRGDTVHLDGTSVTDADLAHLAGFPHLRRIYLDNTGISDAGLTALTRLENLEYVSLKNTKVTRKGVDDFEKAVKDKRTGTNRPPVDVTVPDFTAVPAPPPVTQQPGASPPVTQQPGASPPVTQQPGASPPVTQQPGAPPPVTQQPGAPPVPPAPKPQ